MKSIKRLMAWVRGYFPSKLPTTGKPAFEAFTNSVIEAYGLPNLPTYRETVATMILHHDNKKDSITKHSVAVAIRKAMSNQIAFSVLQDMREEAKKAAEAIAAEKPEVTPQTESLGDSRQ